MRARSRGVSLVELMVAVLLAIVTSVVVLQVLSVYEARKRTATGANDAEIGGAVGLFRLEREVRMAGAGMTLPSNMACVGGLNLFYGAATVSDGLPQAPVRIFDGGGIPVGGVRPPPDRIRILHGDAAFGVAPATIVQGMAAPSSDITVNSAIGLSQGDLLLVGGPDGAETCTLMQMSDAPNPIGNGFLLEHDSGANFPYNPNDPDTVFTNAVSYDVGDIAVNLGRRGLRTFGVVCNDAGVPDAANSCDLAEWDALAAPANPTLAQVASIAPQIVDLQLQYGIAPAGSQVVDSWVDATGAWAAPTAANLARIKAVRIAIVTRGNLEREVVSPETLELFPAIAAGPANPTAAVTMALAADERLYRYKVLSVVVPLVNVIWAGV